MRCPYRQALSFPPPMEITFVNLSCVNLNGKQMQNQFASIGIHLKIYKGAFTRMTKKHTITDLKSFCFFFQFFFFLNRVEFP